MPIMERSRLGPNISKNGLIVNGDDVTIYGLFNEHHNEYQTIWNGNGGRLYFYQSEIPYDVPDQESWMSNNGTVNGYASYKIGDGVTSHEAWGLGIYSYFRDALVKLENAIEAPSNPGIKPHHLTTIWLNGTAGSEITHIVNGKGGSVTSSDNMRQTLNEFVGGMLKLQPFLLILQLQLSPATRLTSAGPPQQIMSGLKAMMCTGTIRLLIN